MEIKGIRQKNTIIITQNEADLIREFLKKYDRFYITYYLLGKMLLDMYSTSGNKEWINNKYTQIFKCWSFTHNAHDIAFQYLIGRVFPMTLTSIITGRLFALKEMRGLPQSYRKIELFDIVLMHYLLLLINYDIDKVFLKDVQENGVNYRLALHIEPILETTDKRELSNTYMLHQICNYLFYNKNQEYSWKIYVFYYVLKKVIKEPLSASTLKGLELDIINAEDINFQMIQENLIVKKSGMLFSPLKEFSWLYFEQWVKKFLESEEVKRNRCPNDLLSQIWTRRKEFMLERLLKKNHYAKDLRIFSEQTIKKRKDIWGKDCDHKWMKKDGPFTPDFLIIRNDVWYIFDLKIVTMESKYYINDVFYLRIINAHASSIQKLMGIVEKNEVYKKLVVNYYISNSLVKRGILLSSIIVGDIVKLFKTEYNQKIPSWLNIKFISIENLEWWFGSKDLDFSNLDEIHPNYQSLVPISGLLTKEMLRYYRSKKELNT